MEFIENFHLFFFIKGKIKKKNGALNSINNAPLEKKKGFFFLLEERRCIVTKKIGPLALLKKQKGGASSFPRNTSSKIKVKMGRFKISQ
jgi:hypothetical protein